MMAEAEARKRGCSKATLNTFSFQAPDFYRKFGYRIVATVDGLPEGHRQHALVKELSSASCVMTGTSASLRAQRCTPDGDHVGNHRLSSRHPLYASHAVR